MRNKGTDELSFSSWKVSVSVSVKFPRVYCFQLLFKFPLSRRRDNVYAKSSAYNYAPLISLNLVLNEINHENESDPIGLLTLL